MARRFVNPCNLKWLQSKSRPKQPVNSTKEIRIVDLFSGCGGLSLGTVEACRVRGISTRIALAADVDREALRVYRENFGDRCLKTEDVPIEQLFQGTLSARISSAERALKKTVGRVDILVAGPPCQGHSDLNNHSRRLDDRNALYARVARAVKVLKPQVVVVENVVGVVNDRGRVVSRSQRHLEQNGFCVKTVCLDARDVGVPQGRRRHFLVGIPTHLAASWLAPTSVLKRSWTISSVLMGLEDEPDRSEGLFTSPSVSSPSNRRRISYLFRNGLYDLPDSQRPACHRDKKHTYKAVYGRLSWNGIANTITSGFGSMGQGRYVHPTRERLITPHEAARLQGFPDWFRFDSVQSRRTLQRMIGNAVIPRVAAWVVGHLLDTALLTPKSIATSACPIQNDDSRRLSA